MHATLLAKVTGTPDHTAWTQIYEFSSPQENKGKLIVLVCLHFATSVTEIERLRRARSVAANIQTSYFQNQSDELLNSLKTALLDAAKDLPPDQSVEIAAVSIVEEIFYAGAVGGASISLVRNNVIAPLIKSIADLMAGSGFYRKDDQLLMMTKDLAQKLPQGVLKGFLETGGAVTFAEQMARFVHKDSDTSSYGIILLGIGENVPTEVKNTIVEKHPIKLPAVRENIVSTLDTLLAKIPERKITIENDTLLFDKNPKKKVTSIAGLALLAILVISIGIGIRRERVQSAKASLTRELTQVRHDFDEAKSLSSLNSERARELAISARNKVRELKESGIEDKDLDELSRNIESEIGTITGIFEGEANLYLDLALISSDFKGFDMASSGERMVVLDNENIKAVEIEIPTKRTKVIAGPDYFRDALSISAYADRSFILSTDGIREVGDEIELVIKPDNWNSNDILLNSFAGNIYLVDKGNNTIYRYAAAGSGFSSKSEWLAPGITIDVTKTVSFNIDGSLWLLSNEGKITKYTQGLPQSFNTSSDFSFFGTVDLFTDESARYIYILDPNNSRILVLSKDGDYKAEYVSDNLKEATKLVVSEKNKKIIFLAQDKLWVIDIKH